MSKISFNIYVIAKQYIISLSGFFVLRLLLFSSEIDRLDASVSLLDILHAFLFGLRFDVVVSGYILILPFVVLTVNTLINKDIKAIRIFILIWINLFFIPAFLVYAGDIPYFNQFFSHITYSTFNFVDENNANFLLNMIVGETKNWFYFFIFLILSAAFFILTKRNIMRTQFYKENLGM